MHTHTQLQIKRALILAGLLLIPALARHGHAQIGLGLTPMRLDLTVAAGAAQSGSLALHNDSQEVARVSTEVMDFYLDDTATPQFVPTAPGERDFSCRNWLTVNPMEFQLGPAQQTGVRYTVRVPAGTPDGGYHCAVVFGTLPLPGAPGMGIRSALRVVAAIYVVVGKPAVNALIKTVNLVYVPDKVTPFWQAVPVLQNRSTVHCRPTGELAVLAGDGRVVETIQLPSLPLLPKRDQAIPIPLKSMREGYQYTLRLRVDFGLRELQEATALVKAEKR